MAAVGVACSGPGDDRQNDAGEDVHDIADVAIYGDATPPPEAAADVDTDANDASADAPTDALIDVGEDG